MLQMVFLDFFEALLGCAEVYVVDAAEQTDMIDGHVVPFDQQPDITAMTSTEPVAVSSLSVGEEVLSVSVA